MESAFFSLATKSNFNKALNHFYKVSEIVDYVDQRRNMADVINVQLDQGEIVNDQILPVVGAIIRDKFGYTYDSYNIPETLVEFNKIVEETSKWTAMDILMVYYNPAGEVMLINPKNVAHFEKARELTKDQLLVIYAKFLKPEPNRKIESEAIEAIEEMIAGKDVFINKEFIDASVQPKAQVRRPAAGPVEAGKKRMTPKYSVQVTNELFHNGNVEAWKKIVESFKVAFPDLDVHIFYENEVINDINTLFKWGKVKSGNLIFFQVAGANIRGVSKLQKYLFEGASPRFEQFLKLGVGKVLNLF